MGDYMEYQIGDLVTRNSYNNDIVFVIVEIKDDIYYLKGVNVRLYADSPVEDLKKYSENEEIEDVDYLERIKISPLNERDDYFYLPGKILHIDGDIDYLNRCLKYYKENKIRAIGINEKEENIVHKIKGLLNDHRPNIIIITGHDAYYHKKGKPGDLSSYKNSQNFISAVKEARNYEKSHEKLIIIAGACQSNYEELIKAGANFASSPKRINIHALDPAVIATRISLSDATKDIDLKGILENTKYGIRGIGGIKTRGTMYVGYPR
ncbi:MAG: sporulation peptidase YabG [Prolixibacteraceae bacterium]|nr:sporulation peptidase YabG [Prolixibacteraceae bacterium]